MKLLKRHLKRIACLLLMIMFFQSCTIYRNSPYSAAEASTHDNKNIKVITNDGKKFVFSWIEEEDGKLISITNTTVEYIQKTDIDRVILNNPFTDTTLKEAMEFDGIIFIKTKNFNKKDRLYNHEFLRIDDRGDQIRGIVKTNKDAATVVLPLETIKNIKVENKEASRLGTTGAVVGSLIVFSSIIFLSSMSSGGWWQ